MNKRSFIIIVAACGLLMPGCTSLVVTKVTPKNDLTVKGQRYALPKPVLEVVPKGDGTMAVTMRYFPDESKAYAIHGSSFGAAHDLEVATAGGLLTRIRWKGDDTAVASKVAESAGVIGQKAIERRQKIEEKAEMLAKEAREKKEKDVEAAEARIRTLRTTFQDAELKLRVAEAAFQADGSPANQLVVEQERIRADDARSRLEEAENERDLLLDSFDAAASPNGALKAWGPLYFAVNEDPLTNQPTLVPTGSQTDYPTAKVPKKKVVKAGNVEFTPTGVVSVAPDARGGHATMILGVNRKLDSITIGAVIDTTNNTPLQYKPLPSYDNAKNRVTIPLRVSEFQVNRVYLLDCSVTPVPASGQPKQPKPVVVRFQILGP